jgi:DNA-binding response OmpR family regulator
METTKRSVLWADDEIDLFRPHILYLEERGFAVTPVRSGDEALSRIAGDRFDAVLLDEMMPGRDGLSTLEEIKERYPTVPVVMITKSEEEDLIASAIRKEITDYIVKPVNPVQVFSALRKVLDREKIREGGIAQEYLDEFTRIRARVGGKTAWHDWVDIYLRLARWDIELERHRDVGLRQTHEDQRREANAEFSKFVEGAYEGWVNGAAGPLLSPGVFGTHVLPHIQAGTKVYFVLVDCMRLDQWLAIESLLSPYYAIDTSYYCSILPTATPYARNAIFAGLFPSEIAKHYPDYWGENSTDERSKNRYERQLLDDYLARKKVELYPAPRYVKIYNTEEAGNVKRQLSSFFSVPLVSLVFNFVDILAHGRSESEILRELAPDESAFRSLMRSWFQHSALFDILRAIAQQDAVVVLTTDHGSVVTRKASVVYGNRETSTNLRYKYGDNLGCDTKHAVHVKDPKRFKLPADSLTKHYIFAKESYYFVYPTKFHEYERQYKGTFQHGGISLEEMILPCVTLRSKRGR